MMAQTSTLRELRLIKRTAWQQIQNEGKREPRPTDNVHAALAVKALLYVACLNWYTLELETELTDAGLFRHTVKHQVKRIQEITSLVHSQAWEMLNKINESGHRYNEEMDRYRRIIDDNVLLPPPERSASIVSTLVRLILRENEYLRPHGFDFVYAWRLRPIPSLLADVGVNITDLDRVIEINVNRK